MNLSHPMKIDQPPSSIDIQMNIFPFRRTHHLREIVVVASLTTDRSMIQYWPSRESTRQPADPIWSAGHQQDRNFYDRLLPRSSAVEPCIPLFSLLLGIVPAGVHSEVTTETPLLAPKKSSDDLEPSKRRKTKREKKLIISTCVIIDWQFPVRPMMDL